MKKNVRKALAISGMALVIGASGLTLDANASTIISSKTTRHERQIHKQSKKLTQKSQRRIIVGKITSITDTAITFTKRNEAFSATITDTTRFLDRNWKAITLSDLKEGDRIRVFGSVTDNSIVARTIRDVSVPDISK